MKLIKSVSGIRGIYKQTLNLDQVAKHSYAFSEIQKNFPCQYLLLEILGNPEMKFKHI